MHHSIAISHFKTGDRFFFKFGPPGSWKSTLDPESWSATFGGPSPQRCPPVPPPLCPLPATPSARTTRAARMETWAWDTRVGWATSRGTARWGRGGPPPAVGKPAPPQMRGRRWAACATPAAAHPSVCPVPRWPWRQEQGGGCFSQKLTQRIKKKISNPFLRFEGIKTYAQMEVSAGKNYFFSEKKTKVCSTKKINVKICTFCWNK